jgi:hypothetical protein
VRADRPRSLIERRLQLSYWLRNGLGQARKAARVLSGITLIIPQRPKKPERLGGKGNL